MAKRQCPACLGSGKSNANDGSNCRVCGGSGEVELPL
jgi:DnaJ-class molecular chaperone